MIYSWGSTQYGQVCTPCPVSSLGQRTRTRRVSRVANCVQLGRGGDDSPYPVPCEAALQIPAPIVQLAVGGGHSVALAADGAVWCGLHPASEHGTVRRQESQK